MSRAGPAISQAQLAASFAGRRSSPSVTLMSSRMNTTVVKQKIVIGSAGRAIAENCGSASPRKIESAKPCVPWRPSHASAAAREAAGFIGLGSGIALETDAHWLKAGAASPAGKAAQSRAGIKLRTSRPIAARAKQVGRIGAEIAKDCPIPRKIRSRR